jgi:uridine kinase
MTPPPPVPPDDLPALERSPLLEHLSPDERHQILTRLDHLTISPGTAIVREGDEADHMFFVLEGQARLLRGALDIGAVRPGDHFGELGLVGTRHRLASVIAESPMRLARLSLQSWRSLVREEPHMAVHLLEGMLETAGQQLTRMTDSVGRLLGQRLLPRRAEIAVALEGDLQPVPTGTTLRHLLPGSVGGSRVVGGLVDSRPVSLDTPVVSQVSVAPLTLADSEGREILRRSAGLVLLEAIGRAIPGARARMLAPLETLQRVALALPPELDAEGAARAKAGIAEIFGRLIAEREPLHEEIWTVEEAREELTVRGWPDAAAMLSVWRDTGVSLVSCGDTYALRTGPVVPDAGFLAGTRVQPDPVGLLLAFGSSVTQHVPRTPQDIAHPEAALAREAAFPRYGGEMVEVQRGWRKALGIEDVGRYNAACVSGRVAELIRVAEGFHEKRLGALADKIAARRKHLRVICIAGPSSSGKTTLIKRLTTQLVIDGLRPVALSLDDYYVDRDATPKDEHGQFDFEALEAIDLPQLQRDLRALLRGETVRTPRFDFKAGLSRPGAGPELCLGDDTLLMLEGIHGLNPALIGDAVKPEQAFRVFIHPAATLPLDRLSPVDPTDVRLLRRIVRDRHGRNLSAAENIQRWASVRRGELLHIYPFQHHADAVFDSALIYEPSVLKVYAERYLLEVPRDHPAQPTARRLRHLLDHYVTIYPEHVPPTSLLREFIGGSGFEY